MARRGPTVNVESSSGTGYRMAFGGVFGCLAAFMVLIALGVGGCTLMAGGCVALVGSSVEQASIARQKAEAQARRDNPAPEITPTVATSTPAEPQVAEEPELVEVSADVVYAYYEQNEVAGDEKLKDKWGIVTGTVDAIGKDILGTPYVALKTRNVLFRVQCMFTAADISALSNLRPGDAIKIKGRCEGKLGNVIFDECSIITSEQVNTTEPSDFVAPPIDDSLPDVAEAPADFGADDRADRPTRVIPKPTEHDWREWSTADGRFSIEAKFRSSSNGKVRLEKRDGSTVDVPLSKLSDDDQAFVGDLR